LLRFPEFVYFTAIRSVHGFVYAHTSLAHQILTTHLPAGADAAAVAAAAAGSPVGSPGPVSAADGGAVDAVAFCRYAPALHIASAADAGRVYALLSQLADRALLAKMRQEDEEQRRRRGVAGFLSKVSSVFGSKDKDAATASHGRRPSDDTSGASAPLVVGAGHALRPLSGAVTFATFARYVSHLSRLSEQKMEAAYGLAKTFEVGPEHTAAAARAAAAVAAAANVGTSAAAAAAAGAPEGEAGDAGDRAGHSGSDSDDDDAEAAASAAAAAAAAAAATAEHVVLAWGGAKVKPSFAVTTSAGTVGTSALAALYA
jgi:hypothetical protein